MTKERIKSNQFCTFDQNCIVASDFFDVADSLKDEVKKLFERSSSICEVNKVAIGIIVEKNDDGIKVDLGYKALGYVPHGEFNIVEFKNLKVGDSVEVLVEKLESNEGIISISCEKAKSAKAWEVVLTNFKENKPVKGIVTNKVKGGLYVDIGVNAFLPGSQIDTQRVVDFDQWIGQEIQAYIVKIMPKRGNVIISRRKFVYEQKSEVRREALNNLVEGEIIEGIVKNTTKYGAFVDIQVQGNESVDGLLHITDMSWKRIEDPSEIVSVGQKIKVKVLTLDKVNEKISLGLKQLTENPWNSLSENVAVGSIVSGKIISIKDYGIFVEVMEGVEGLVHISEVSWTDRISDLHKYFKIGQEVFVAIVSLERKGRRMSLSIKQIEKNPWDVAMEKYQVGDKVNGKVTNIADFGFFLRIAPGIDGLVHISDISWVSHVKHPSDLYKKGDSVDAIITEINRQKRKISLSVKSMQENPWNNVNEKVKVGNYVAGSVVRIVDFGAFVKLKDMEVEAFIHASECSDIPNITIADILSVGNEYNFRVIKVSVEEQKIGLSLRTKVEDGGRRGSGDSSSSYRGRGDKSTFSSRNVYEGKKRSSEYFHGSKPLEESSNNDEDKKLFSLQLELKRLLEQQRSASSANFNEVKEDDEKSLSDDATSNDVRLSDVSLDVASGKTELLDRENSNDSSRKKNKGDKRK